MDMIQWLSSIRVMLDKLKDLDFGYPIGENIIYPPGNQTLVKDISTKLGEQIPTSIVEFYAHCNGISLPDVHNGYFIHSVDLILRGIERGEPVKVSGIESYPVVVFGSDGGGGRFVTRLGNSEEVLYLPIGAVRNSTFDGKATPVKSLSLHFEGFLMRLLTDVEAYIQNNPRHQYMA